MSRPGAPLVISSPETIDRLQADMVTLAHSIVDYCAAGGAAGGAAGAGAAGAGAGAGACQKEEEEGMVPLQLQRCCRRMVDIRLCCELEEGGDEKDEGQEEGDAGDYDYEEEDREGGEESNGSPGLPPSSFGCHSFILCSRSDYFKTLLRQQWVNADCQYC